MRGILRQTLQRFHNDRLDTGILDRARRAGTRLVMQTVDSPLDKPAAPFADRVLGNSQAGCNFLVLQTLRAFKNNAGAERQRLRGLSPRRKLLQLRSLCLAENQFRHHPSHLRSPFLSSTTLAQQRESVMTRTSESGH
jgi:hypothetical protein